MPLTRPNPAWWTLEQIEASGTVPAAELARDRTDFLALWADVAAPHGEAWLAGRREVGLRGLPTGEAVGRPVWVTVDRDGSPRVVLPDESLPGPSDPAPILISPIPARGPRHGKQWRASDLWLGWPWLTIDIDAGDVERIGLTVDAVLDRIRPLPTLVVRSGGGGAHVWIALTELVSMTRGTDWNRCLADLHSGDPMQARNRPSLRLPGSVNVKWHLDLEIPPRLCRIDRERSDFGRRYSAAEIERAVSKPQRWYLAHAGPTRDAGDCPAWVEATLRALGCRSFETTTRVLGVVARTVVVPDVCPVCGQRGTAWVYVDDDEPRLGCHRRTCPGLPDLRRAAESAGVEIEEDDDRPLHDAFRPRRLESQITVPDGTTFQPGVREVEQDAIAEAARAAWDHAQTTDPRRILWVVETSTGVGKDFVLSRAIEETVPAGRWDVYGKSQKHLHDKAEEWPNRARRLRLHVSPLSLVGPRGERCRKLQYMSRNVRKGWEATRVCLESGPLDEGRRTPCEHYASCVVRSGVLDRGGQQDPTVDLYTTRRLEAVGPVEPDRVAWIDETFQLTYSTETSEQELEAFSRSRDVPVEYRRLAAALLATGRALPVGQHPIEPSPGAWDPSFRSLPRPELPSRTTRPDGETPRYPRWSFDLCWTAWHLARGEDPQAVLWHRARPNGDDPPVLAWTLHRRTLDRLPRASIWTNATYWLWSDIVEATPGLEVRRVGRRVEPRYLHRFHFPHPRATRGHSNDERLIVRTDDGRKVCNEEFRETIVAAVAFARQQWAEISGDDPDGARILIATYKAIAEHGFGRGGADFCEQTGANAVDYYERLVGTNEFAGWEGVVMVGTPYPGPGPEDLVISRLYTPHGASFSARVAQDTIEQTTGRLRAITSSKPQVAVAVTAEAPLAWRDSTITVVDPLGECVKMAQALGAYARSVHNDFPLFSECMATFLERYPVVRQLIFSKPELLLIRSCKSVYFQHLRPIMYKDIAALAGFVPSAKNRKGPKYYVNPNSQLSDYAELLDILAFLAKYQKRDTNEHGPNLRANLRVAAKNIRVAEWIDSELRTVDLSSLRGRLDEWIATIRHKRSPSTALASSD